MPPSRCHRHLDKNSKRLSATASKPGFQLMEKTPPEARPGRNIALVVQSLVSQESEQLFAVDTVQY